MCWLCALLGLELRLQNWRNFLVVMLFRVTIFNCLFDLGCVNLERLKLKGVLWVRGWHESKVASFGNLIFGISIVGFTVEVHCFLLFFEGLKVRQIPVVSSGWNLCVGFIIGPFYKLLTASELINQRSEFEYNVKFITAFSWVG